MAIKKCKYCGNMFDAKGNTVYCSEKCRIAGNKQTAEQWKDKTGYREKHADYMKKLRTKSRTFIDAQREISRLEIKTELIANNYNLLSGESARSDAQELLEQAKEMLIAENIEECQKLISEIKDANDELSRKTEEIRKENERRAEEKSRIEWNRIHANDDEDGKQAGYYWI